MFKPQHTSSPPQLVFNLDAGVIEPSVSVSSSVGLTREEFTLKNIMDTAIDAIHAVVSGEDGEPEWAVYSLEKLAKAVKDGAAHNAIDHMIEFLILVQSQR